VKYDGGESWVCVKVAGELASVSLPFLFFLIKSDKLVISYPLYLAAQKTFKNEQKKLFE
jgi:hypothetical protein